MNKKLTVVSIAATGFLAAASILPVVALAAGNTSVSDNFVTKLAAKLGIDQSAVQTAVDSVHTEMRAERMTEMTSDIQQAVTDGKLTQRQADILLAMANIEPTKPDLPADLGTLTEEERQAQREQLRAEREQSVLDALSSVGISTSTEEIREAVEAARAAGLKGKFMPFGKRGPGMKF